MQKVFRVYDSKAEAYLPAFNALATGAGIRMFIEASDSPDHAFHRHQADYTLFEVGMDDEINGQTTYYEAKRNLGTALELSGKEEAAVAAKDMNEWHEDGKKLAPVRGGE